MHLQPNSKYEVFNLRMNKTTKKQLIELSKDNLFKNNRSEVIRYLIDQEHAKRAV